MLLFLFLFLLFLFFSFVLIFKAVKDFQTIFYQNFFFRSHSSHLIFRGALSDAEYGVLEGWVTLLLSLRVSKVSLENCQLNWKGLVQDGWQVNGERSLLANYFSWSNRKMEGPISHQACEIPVPQAWRKGALWGLAVQGPHSKRGPQLYMPLNRGFCSSACKRDWGRASGTPDFRNTGIRSWAGGPATAFVTASTE